MRAMDARHFQHRSQAHQHKLNASNGRTLFSAQISITSAQVSSTSAQMKCEQWTHVIFSTNLKHISTNETRAMDARHFQHRSQAHQHTSKEVEVNLLPLTMSYIVTPDQLWLSIININIATVINSSILLALHSTRIAPTHKLHPSFPPSHTHIQTHIHKYIHTPNLKHPHLHPLPQPHLQLHQPHS